jgi:ATP-dependent DNA helicase RecG
MGEQHDLQDIVQQLRSQGGDTADVEAKTAAGGLPETVAATLSAFANRPGGGAIILGLDESAGFKATGISDAQNMAQQLVNKARNRFSPPIVVDIVPNSSVDGKEVVFAIVQECPKDQKPCRELRSGKAYIRAYDGDYQMSELEEQGLLARRTPPEEDLQPVEKATLSDLDDELVQSWLRNVRRADSEGIGRYDESDMLVLGGLCTKEKIPTLAGVMTVGKYPQQFFPMSVIRAVSIPSVENIRASDDQTITGPIPLMISRAIKWAEQTFHHHILEGKDGHVYDSYEYPLEAFREIICNALIHRDYAAWSRGSAIEVRRYHDQLVTFNPGGLYGISTDQLGVRPLTSARNPHLLNICKHLYVNEQGQRVVEALAQGIPTIQRALHKADLLPAQFDDTGVSFRVRLRNLNSREEVKSRLLSQLDPTRKAVVESVQAGNTTVNDIAQAVNMSTEGTRRILKELTREGVLSVQKKPNQRAYVYSVT